MNSNVSQVGMNINVSQVVDGVTFHAEVKSIEDAEKFLAFLNKKAADAMDAQVKGLPAPELGRVFPATAADPTTPVFTRESLQPIVVALAKQRETLAALLAHFGVKRFRELPDDMLQDFGMACVAAGVPA